MDISNKNQSGQLPEQVNIQLFHASSKPIVGFLNNANRFIKSEKHWIEEEFERFRNGRSFSRLTAFFATATVAECFWFHKIQTGCAPAFLYRVKMTNPHRHPMVLIGKAESHQGIGKKLEVIVEEYWHPTENWNFLESLDSSIEIVERVELPAKEIVDGAAHRYGQDQKLANKLWPRQSPLVSAFIQAQEPLN
jgi:hypothetical protein